MSGDMKILIAHNRYREAGGEDAVVAAERALLAHLRAALRRTPESERTFPRPPSRASGPATT